jgi:DNA primase
MALGKLGSRFDLASYLKARYKTPSEMVISGDEYQVDHDECGDDRKRLWVNVEKRLSYCYRCEASYDLVGLLRHLDSLSLTDAIRRIRDATPKTIGLAALRSKLDLLLDVPEDEEEAAPQPIRMPTGYRSCAEEAEWPDYIEQRLGSRRLAVKHDLGWCWMGHFAGRMIIPVILRGKPVSFAARLMRKKRDDEGKDYVPYLYPKKRPGQAGHIQLLFNYDRFSQHRTVVLTEGSLDAIHVGDQGAGLLGKSLSQSKLALLLSGEVEEVVTLLDGDGPGREATEKISALLSPILRVRNAWLPEGVDPDEVERSELRTVIGSARAFNPRRSFREHVRRNLR